MASKYSLEKIMDWLAHLGHLQAFVKEFDAEAAPSKDLLI